MHHMTQHGVQKQREADASGKGRDKQHMHMLRGQKEHGTDAEGIPVRPASSTQVVNGEGVLGRGVIPEPPQQA